jgi:hypothetical protein
VTGLGSGVQQISLGFDSGCALTTGGGVQCWGYNGNGQLGDGTRTMRLTPVDVFGLTSGVAAISAGWDHTCAVMNTGGVKCWGNNADGEIGDGTKTDRLKPVDVTGLSSGVAAVSAGFDHTCALLNSGGVKCWGNNGRGELGDGTHQTRKVPVNVSGLSSGVGSISAGYNHTCAVTNSGVAKCWGNNDSGQLGIGSTKSRSKPTNVYRLSSVASISASGGFRHHESTCATTTSGLVKCWGNNRPVSGLLPINSTGGQLGDGTAINRFIPITVRGFTGNSPKAYRPDGSISKLSNGPFQGGNVYNKTGANQVKKAKISASGSAHFFIKVQNDANVADSFFLIGPASNAAIRVKYYFGSKNITPKITSGTFWTSIAPGASKILRLVVSPNPGTSKKEVRVTARSAGDSKKVDAVKAIVVVG